MALVSPIKQQELSINEYVASIGLNPSNVYYASYSSTNVSPQQAQWNIQSPNKRNLLLSYAQIQWTVSFRREESLADNLFDYGTDIKWQNELPYISFKGPLPFAGAMSSITISINGTTQTMSQPRNFMHQLAAMCVTQEEAKKCYESTYWEDSGGLWPADNPGNRGKAISVDSGLMANEAAWQRNMLESSGLALFNEAAPNTRTVVYTEPVIAPPFNPFSKVQAGIPNYLWFKKMSHVIPNIDRLEVDIQFTKLAESIFLSRYIQASGTNQRNQRIRITDLSADILLYWYEMPSTMEIPKQVDLQSWQVREFTTAVDALVAGTTRDVDSPLIQLRSVPTLIILSCIRDKDSQDYDGSALSRDDDADSANDVAITARNSMDYWCRFTKIDVILGDRPMVISSTFTQAELYYLTTKNSKYPYPYSFDEWLGKLVPVWSAPAADVAQVSNAAAAFRRQTSRMSIAFRAKDLAEKLSDGIFTPTTLQFRVTVQSRQGFAGQSDAATHKYRLFVHVFDGKSFLRLEPDRAQFQLQSVSLEAARAATQPVLEGGSLRLGGSLDRLRSRGIEAVDRYLPRVL